MILPLTGERLIGTPACDPPLPGEIPSCLLYDETLPEPFRHNRKAEDSTMSTFECIPKEIAVEGENSWAVVNLAYTSTFFDMRPKQLNNWQHPGKFKMNRVVRKTMAELPFPERSLDFVEYCAIEAASGAPTQEEAQQNLASMEIFHPGWQQMAPLPIEIYEKKLLLEKTGLSNTFDRKTNIMMEEELVRSGYRCGWPENHISPLESGTRVRGRRVPITSPRRRGPMLSEENRLGDRLRGVLEKSEQNIGISTLIVDATIKKCEGIYCP